jgi:hypothetical protein
VSRAPTGAVSVARSHHPGASVLAAVEHFGGGQTLWGADVVIDARISRFVLAELRAGGRGGADVVLPWVHVTTRAGTASAAVGLNVWSKRRRIGFAVMGRAQGYLVEIQSEPAGRSDAGAGRALAFLLAAEPRLFVTMTKHLSLTIAAAAGASIHGVVLETQGSVSRSFTGVSLSANLGAVFTF